jgi:hypothetical protein
MTGEKRKTEPPFGLDMDFGEALGRFVRVDPKEVAESIDRSKQKRPPEDGAPRRPARGERGAPPGKKAKPDGA